MAKDQPTGTPGAKKPPSKTVAGEPAAKKKPAPKETQRPSSSTSDPGDGPRATGGGEKAATVLGEYKLLKKLGQGGMGAVYKAQHVSTEEIVAVKVLSKELSAKPAYVQRFMREVNAMKKLDHPHVLRCLDNGEQKPYHYLVIEFIEGGSVEDQLKKSGRFELGDALHLILKTAEGLQHAHEKSMIHRDVKPDNILLTKDGIVKIADLGLAKDTEDSTSLTKTGTGAGTPIYMAPEQARDVKHVDARTDIYALGVMLYVFLTGQPPFNGATLVEVISAKEKGVYDPIRKHNPDVPPKIDLIVSKMMAKDVKYRYSTCAEVIEALEPLGLANETLSFIHAVEQPTEMEATPMPAPTQLANKANAAKTKAASMGRDTDEPVEEKTEIPESDPDIWFMQLKTKTGKDIIKKVTTDQIRTMIKAGHINAQTQVSKSEKTGFRSAGAFSEFQSQFKARETTTKATAKGQSNEQKYKDLLAAEDRRKRWGWLSRAFKGGMRFVVGMLVIITVVGGVGFALWYGYNNFVK